MTLTHSSENYPPISCYLPFPPRNPGCCQHIHTFVFRQKEAPSFPSGTVSTPTSRSARPRPSPPGIPTKALPARLQKAPQPGQQGRVEVPVLPGRAGAQGLRWARRRGPPLPFSPRAPRSRTLALTKDLGGAFSLLESPRRGRDSPEHGAEEEAGAQGQEPAGPLPHRLPRLPAAAGQRRRILPGRGTAGKARAAAACTAEEKRPLEWPRRNATRAGASAAVTTRRSGPLPPGPYPFTR